MLIQDYEDFFPFYSSNILDENAFELLNNSCKIVQSIKDIINDIFNCYNIHTIHKNKIEVIHYDEDKTIISDINTFNRGGKKLLYFCVDNKYNVYLPLEILFTDSKSEISKIIEDYNNSLPIELEERYNSEKESLMKRKERRIESLYKGIDKRILDEAAKLEEEYNTKLKELNETFNK